MPGIDGAFGGGRVLCLYAGAGIVPGRRHMIDHWHSPWARTCGLRQGQGG